MRLFFLLFTLPLMTYGQCIENDWLGTYDGVMEIYGRSGLQQNVGVRFDLKPLDEPFSWSYTMNYINQKNHEIISTKAYKIVYKEESNTCWMDEGDGLLIEMNLLGNCFYDHFQLNDMFYNSSLCKEGNDLLFCITGGKKKPTYSSPHIVEAGGVVETMRIDFLQRVKLNLRQ